MRLIDLSRTIHQGMPVHPYDDPISLVKEKDIAEDGFTDYRLSTGSHIGTHVDGPMHLLGTELFIGEVGLESFCGRAWRCDVIGRNAIEPGDLETGKFAEGDMVILYTGWGEKYGTEVYYKNHPVVSEALARVLADLGIKLIGFDLPSPDIFPFSVHKIFMAKGIIILENLTNLDKLPGDQPFELFAFPLKMESDSSPVRAVARLNVSY